jgi:hypothetical protein
LESAVSFTTDLTAQYELGFNTVNDVNFSMETAHLAKNQILQQAANSNVSAGKCWSAKLIATHTKLVRITIKLSQQTLGGVFAAFFCELM